MLENITEDEICYLQNDTLKVISQMFSTGHPWSILHTHMTKNIY